MNENIKNYLGYALILFVLVGSFAAISYVRTYSDSIEPGTYRSFNVSGEGKVVAVPDVAEFSFSVITQGGKDLASLQKDNTAKVNKIIEFIKKSGVEAKDIKTQYYSVDPRYQTYTCKRTISYPSAPEPAVMPGYGVSGSSGSGTSMAYPVPVDNVCPPADIVGYTVNQSVSVKVRDFAKIGELLTGAVSNGANSVSQLSFVIDDPTELRNQARAEAIAKAQVQAKNTAKAAGFRLGRLLSIDEGYYPVYRGMETMAYGKGGDASVASPAPSIEPGSQEITITVNLRYEIR